LKDALIVVVGSVLAPLFNLIITPSRPLFTWVIRKSGIIRFGALKMS
jgi:hypothetical protein